MTKLLAISILLAACSLLIAGPSAIVTNTADKLEFGSRAKIEVSKDGTITKTASDSDHTVTLTAGKVSVSGSNGAGQRDAPKDTFVAIASGYSHSVGLLEDGTVRVWGHTAHGQGEIPKDMPRITAIACGHSHTLALDANGRVWAWGLNANGQCAVPEEALRDIVKISAVDFQSLAVDSKGRIITWGEGGQTIYEPEAKK